MSEQKTGAALPCKPVFVDGAWPCSRCKVLRLPCTWTLIPEIIKWDWYDLLIHGRIVSKDKIEDIPGPSLALARDMDLPEEVEEEIHDDEDLEDEDV